MWQCLCILQRHKHPPVEERVNGRVADDEIDCGNDSNGIVALTPDRLGGHGDDCAVVHEVRRIADDTGPSQVRYCEVHVPGHAGR